MPTGPRDWMPKLDQASRRKLGDRLERMLNHLILEQKKISGYKGPDQDFAQFVAENDWDWQLLAMVFNSGYIQALLDMAKMLHVELPEALKKEANDFMNEGPQE